MTLPLPLPSERATEVVKERRKQYGNPSEVYSIASQLFAIYMRKKTGVPHRYDAEDVAWFLNLVKHAREWNQKHPEGDNLTDICGYANVIEMMRNG